MSRAVAAAFRASGVAVHEDFGAIERFEKTPNGVRMILGCHVVGDRAVDIVQLAALAIASGMSVEALARFPFSFPTYAGVLGRAALGAVRRMSGDVDRVPPIA